MATFKLTLSRVFFLLFLLLTPHMVTIAHELGHYFTLMAVGVHTSFFEIGLGLEVFSFVYDSTTFKFHLYPLGGGVFPDVTIIDWRAIPVGFAGGYFGLQYLLLAAYITQRRLGYGVPFFTFVKTMYVKALRCFMYFLFPFVFLKRITTQGSIAKLHNYLSDNNKEHYFYVFGYFVISAFGQVLNLLPLNAETDGTKSFRSLLSLFDINFNLYQTADLGFLLFITTIVFAVISWVIFFFVAKHNVEK